MDTEDIACRACGNTSPARIDAGGCEACLAFPRCFMCGAWTDLVPSQAVTFIDGSVQEICDVCLEKAS